MIIQSALTELGEFQQVESKGRNILHSENSKLKTHQLRLA